MDLLSHDQTSNDFVGEGSYGCVYYPGINCKGKKNTKKNKDAKHVKGDTTQGIVVIIVNINIDIIIIIIRMGIC